MRPKEQQERISRKSKAGVEKGLGVKSEFAFLNKQKCLSSGFYCSGETPLAMTTLITESI